MADQGSHGQRGTAGGSGGSSPGASTVAVRNGEAGNGRVSKRDSDEIVAEIERTRQNLARTIDSLADRVSPSGNVRRLRELAAEQAAKPEVQLAAVAATLAVTGIAIYRIWGRRRR